MKAEAEKISFFEKHKCHSKTLRKERMLKQDENALKIYIYKDGIFVLRGELFFSSGENIQYAIVPCQRKDQQTYQKMCMFIVVSK